MTQQMAFDTSGSTMLVFPLLPYTAPPTDAASNPRVQKTEAKPPAKASVGKVVDESLRSPAALEMYDIVNGSKPQTQGDTAVNKPAPYMMGMLETKLEGSSKEMEASDEAVDWAWNMTSSKFIMLSWVDAWLRCECGVLGKLLAVCECLLLCKDVVC